LVITSAAIKPKAGDQAFDGVSFMAPLSCITDSAIVVSFGRRDLGF
jgi:hypothetical protein